MSRRGWGEIPRCALCGTRDNLEYCSMCKHYFCAECKGKYPERVMAMMKEKSQTALDWIANWLGIKQ